MGNQSAQETQPSKDADYSLDSSVAPASSEPVYSDALSRNAPYMEGLLVTAGDDLDDSRHDLISSAASNQFDNETTPPDRSSACKPQPPSLSRFENRPQHEATALAGPSQCQENAAETATRGKTDNPADEEATEEQLAQTNRPIGGQDVRNHIEENGAPIKNDRTSTLSSNQQLQPARQPKVFSTQHRSLRHRHKRSGSRTQLPSVSVVIPVRRPHRLMAGNIENPKGYGRRERRKRNNNLTTHDSARDRSSVSRSGHEEGREHPRKRCRHTPQSKRPACNNQKLAGQSAGRLTGVSQQSPNLGSVTGPNETKEVFGRGILRIQSHGPRHAYFMTFLPDATHCDTALISPETPRGSSQDSSADSSCLSKRRQATHQASSKRIRSSSATEMGHKSARLASDQIQKTGTTRSGGNKRPRVASRKGMPWSREEEDLLKTLRKDRNLPWSEVARCFTNQFPGRSQGSMQVYWSSRN